MTQPIRTVRVPGRPVRTVRVFAGPAGDSLTWRGAWSSATVYAPLDAVSHGKSSYVCTAAVGPTATTPDADAAHWGVLAEGGIDGTGTMNGPASAVDGNLAVFDGTTGKLVKDGGAVPATPTWTTLTGKPSTFPPVVGTGATDAMAGNKTASDLGGVAVASGITTVRHGTTAATARPAGADVVWWIGTVEPTNAVAHDVWDDAV